MNNNERKILNQMDEAVCEFDASKVSGTIDPFRNLLHLALYGYSFRVTLNVRGAAISGTLIGRKEFLTAFHQTLVLLIKNSDEGVSENFLQYIDIFNISQDEEECWRNGLSLDCLTYVYLKDAKINSLASSEIPANSISGLWCGSVDSVDGFIIGCCDDKLHKNG